jgi:hypothetical protein
MRRLRTLPARGGMLSGKEARRDYRTDRVVASGRHCRSQAGRDAVGAVRAPGGFEDHGAVEQPLEERRRQRRVAHRTARTLPELIATNPNDRTRIREARR